MASKQPGIKRLLVASAFGVVAALGSIVLLVLNDGQPNSLPIFFVTLVAMSTIAPVAARAINRLRFKRWRRRGWTEL